MYFMIAKPSNAKITLNFNDERGYTRKTDFCLSVDEYYYYKWSITEDFVKTELERAKKEAGVEAEVFKTESGKYLVLVNEEPAAYLTEKIIEEKRRISSQAFYEYMVAFLSEFAQKKKTISFEGL